MNGEKRYERAAAERGSADWLADLEQRVQALEARVRRSASAVEVRRMDKEEELVRRYGDCVDKTVAAQILGVTRATVYAMLADGRVTGACGGRRVDVRSIAAYMTCDSMARAARLCARHAV